jgi:hypothetical protein
MSCFGFQKQGGVAGESQVAITETVLTSKGTSFNHNSSCACNGKKVAGLITFVISIIALICAIILATNVFGGGETGLIAGGLVVGGVILLAISCILLARKQDMP